MTGILFEQDVLNILVRAARDGGPCPSTREIALEIEAQHWEVQDAIRGLKIKGVICVEVSGSRRRIEIPSLGIRTGVSLTPASVTASSSDTGTMAAVEAFDRAMIEKGYRFEDVPVKRGTARFIHSHVERSSGVAEYGC